MLLALEAPVEAHEACEKEEWEIALLFQLGAPVPGGGQTPVDTGACVEEVVCPRAIKRMAKEVRQDVLACLLHYSEGADDVRAQVGIPTVHILQVA